MLVQPLDRKPIMGHHWATGQIYVGPVDQMILSQWWPNIWGNWPIYYFEDDYVKTHKTKMCICLV